MVATRWLRAAAPLLILVAGSLAVDSDFSFYPQNAQACLNQASSQTNCNGSANNKDLNQCLCSNTGDFVTNSAKCIGQKDPADIDSTYDTMSQACATSDTPITISKSKWDTAAKGSTKEDTSTKTTTTKSSDPTSTSGTKSSATNGSTDTSKDDGGGLSTGAIIGIGVGAGVVCLAAVAGLIIFVIRRRRRRGEESHPMLPQHMSAYGPPTTFPPAEPSPAFENERKPAWVASGLTPSHSPSHPSHPSHSPSHPSHSPSHTISPNASSMTGWTSPQQGWTSPQQGWTAHNDQQTHYVGPYAAPPPVAELPPESAARATGPVFEMDVTSPPAFASSGGHAAGHEGAVEMQGSEPPSHYRQI